MLFTKNLKNAKFKKKLFYKFTKLFKIKNVIESQSYRLRLPDQWRIHFVFYIFLLILYYINANIVLSAKIIFMNENKEYEVKNILKNKKKWEKLLKRATKCVAVLTQRLGSIGLDFMDIRLGCPRNHDWSSSEGTSSDLDNRSLDDKQATRSLLLCSVSIKT